MSAYWLLENIWAYSVQFAAVAGLALALARLSRRASPGARMALLQLGLLAALCAPLLQVQSGPVLTGPSVGVVTIETSTAAPEPAPGVRPTTVVLAVLAAGVVLRLGWTLLGLAALANRRRRARQATVDCPEFLDLRRWLGVDAELLAGASSPVAFGFFRPAVLAPESLLAAGGQPLRAVLAHELVHLRRRDWLFVLAEELLLAALWFHPLAWLLIREIRLTREEVVDEEAALAVSGAEDYLDALLAVARLRFQPAHSPGAEFLRERQIARRIETLIQQENPMSRSLQYSVTSASVLAVAGAAWWVASFTPLQGAPQVVPHPNDADSITVSQGAEGLILPKQTRPLFAQYSLGALLAGIEGQVTLELTLDDGGNVVDARAISGPLELRQEAVRSALDWRYDTSVQRSRNVVATVSFKLPKQSPQVSFPVTAVQNVVEHADVPASSLVLRSVQVDLTPSDPTLQSKLESYIGQSFAQNPNLGWLIYGDIINSIESVSAPRSIGWVSLTAEGAVLTVRRAEAPSRPTIGQGPKTGPPAVPDRIRVGAAVQSSRAIEKTTPNYPALARQAKVQGSVSLSVILSKAGGVQSVDVISGHPLLIPAAIEAVKQWRYKPTLLNGNPVEVETTVDINFSLSE